MAEETVIWARVKELLDGIMDRWDIQARRAVPGIHDYWWNTPEELANNKPYGRQLIEPGVPGKDTHLIIFLHKGVGSIPKMPRGGPFLSSEEVDEIERWIDAGMPG